MPFRAARALAAALCASLPLFVLGAPDTCDDTTLQHEVVAWVVAHGGSFHPHQEFRRRVPGDPASPFGVFASAEIEEGALLARVPWRCVLTDPDGGGPFVTEYIQGYRDFYCEAGRYVAAEMRAGAGSFFAPYTAYLMAQESEGGIPSSWSAAGRSLLAE
eukprot:CAMPEP_0194338808 /NCGR_PEP_ID=MMETSP0171-20130528/80849_1 /TAXON_ID=218684 /ORGANISM="Corethron pennatum, Strain L29A3" /LENGTH=159 /DNA_ID=CAMNT_0039103093 /DNA_START=206 /DNA_END=682 /DNA_ORIENTATION=+